MSTTTAAAAAAASSSSVTDPGAAAATIPPILILNPVVPAGLPNPATPAPPLVSGAAASSAGPAGPAPIVQLTPEEYAPRIRGYSPQNVIDTTHPVFQNIARELELSDLRSKIERLSEGSTERAELTDKFQRMTGTLQRVGEVALVRTYPAVTGRDGQPRQLIFPDPEHKGGSLDKKYFIHPITTKELLQNLGIVIKMFFPKEMKEFVKITAYVYLINGPLKEIIELLREIHAGRVNGVDLEERPDETVTEASQQLDVTVAREGATRGAVYTRDNLRMFREALIMSFLFNPFFGKKDHDIFDSMVSLSKGSAKLFAKLLIEGNVSTGDLQEIIDCLEIMKNILSGIVDYELANPTFFHKLINRITDAAERASKGIRAIYEGISGYLSDFSNASIVIGRSVIVTILSGTSGTVGYIVTTRSRLKTAAARASEAYNSALSYLFGNLFQVMESVEDTIKQSDEAAEAATKASKEAAIKSTEMRRGVLDKLYSFFVTSNTTDSDSAIQEIESGLPAGGTIIYRKVPRLPRDIYVDEIDLRLDPAALNRQRSAKRPRDESEDATGESEDDDATGESEAKRPMSDKSLGKPQEPQKPLGTRSTRRRKDYRKSRKQSNRKKYRKTKNTEQKHRITRRR